ncbi:hypothetical protein NBRC10513v2_002016 [Rhodotorula toruloides]
MSSLSDLDFLNQTLTTPSGGTNGSSTDAAHPTTASRAAAAPPAATRQTDAPPPTSSSTIDASMSSLLATLHSAQTAATRLSTVVPALEDGAAQGGAEGEEMDEQALNAMLERLDEAEGAADDLEGRLDGLISNLDELLGALGAVEGQEKDGEADLSGSVEAEEPEKRD